MMRLKITTIGNSTGVILPKDAMAKLNVQKGDALLLTDTPDGFILTPYDEAFELQMKAAESVVSRYRDALRELAK